jgi:hypothetical protein
MKKIIMIILMLCLCVAGAAGAKSYYDYKKITANSDMSKDDADLTQTTEIGEDEIDQSTTTEAASTEDTEEVTEEYEESSFYQKAYRNLLESGTIADWGQNGTEIQTGNCKFALINLDADNTPELVVYNDSDASHADGYYQVYRADNGQAELIANTGDEILYYPNQSVLVNSHTGMGTTSRAYGQVSGNSISYFAGSIETTDAEEEGENGEKNGYTYYEFSGILDFNDANEIEEGVFTERLQQVIGEAGASGVNNWYDNTAENRKEFLE